MTPRPPCFTKSKTLFYQGFHDIPMIAWNFDAIHKTSILGVIFSNLLVVHDLESPVDCRSRIIMSAISTASF